jgi:hypothetical protein
LIGCFVLVSPVFSLMKTVYKSKHVGGTHDYLLLIVQFVRLNTVITILGAATLVSTAVAQWLRYCATNQKVAGSIPDGVMEFSLT